MASSAAFRDLCGTRMHDCNMCTYNIRHLNDIIAKFHNQITCKKCSHCLSSACSLSNFIIRAAVFYLARIKVVEWKKTRWLFVFYEMAKLIE